MIVIVLFVYFRIVSTEIKQILCQKGSFGHLGIFPGGGNKKMSAETDIFSIRDDYERLVAVVVRVLAGRERRQIIIVIVIVLVIDIGLIG